MSWIYNNEGSQIICRSAKHNREVTIDLPREPGVITVCKECWRSCVFSRERPSDGLGYEYIRFEFFAAPPQKEV